MMTKYTYVFLLFFSSTVYTNAYSEYKALEDGLYALAESFMENGEITTSLAIVKLKVNGNKFSISSAEENTKIDAKGIIASNGDISMVYEISNNHSIKYISTTAQYSYAYGKIIELLDGKEYYGSWEIKKIPMPPPTKANEEKQVEQ